MKKNRIIVIVTLFILLLHSCKSKTQQLLTKKWDCIKVENLDLGGERFQNPQDSVNTVQALAALESLNWTFKDNHEYECAIAGKVMLRGSYGLTDDEKTLVCTPVTKNTINRYTITVLTEYDMVLSTGNPPLVLHFKPH